MAKISYQLSIEDTVGKGDDETDETVEGTLTEAFGRASTVCLGLRVVVTRVTEDDDGFTFTEMGEIRAVRTEIARLTKEGMAQL
jgi:hypothetical protein